MALSNAEKCRRRRERLKEPPQAPSGPTREDQLVQLIRDLVDSNRELVAQVTSLVTALRTGAHGVATPVSLGVESVDTGVASVSLDAAHNRARPSDRISSSLLSLNQEIKGLGSEIQDRNGARASANGNASGVATPVSKVSTPSDTKPPSQDPDVPSEAGSSTHQILRSQPTTPSQTSVHKTGQARGGPQTLGPLPGSLTVDQQLEARRKQAALLGRWSEETEKTEKKSKGVH